MGRFISCTESEPYMTLALPSVRRDYGVIVAQVNLKFIREVISQIKVGKGGKAYLVDGQGRLIAHPDISLVLRNVSFSSLPQVQAALTSPSADPPEQMTANDNTGREVLSAFAPIAPLAWFVFVELPTDEAYASLYSIARSAAWLLAALGLAVFRLLPRAPDGGADSGAQRRRGPNRQR